MTRINGAICGVDTRRFLQTDYETFAGWLIAKGAPEPPTQDEVPGFGIVAEDSKGACGFVFLILDHSTEVAIADFLVLRPGLELMDSREAVFELAERAADEAKSMGYRKLIAYAPRALLRLVSKAGWNEWPGIELGAIQKKL